MYSTYFEKSIVNYFFKKNYGCKILSIITINNKNKIIEYLFITNDKTEYINELLNK